MRFVVNVVRFVVDVMRFVVDVVMFVVDVVKFVVDVMRFVVDVVRFAVDVMTFVVEARAELVRKMCISQHYRFTDFLKTNLKMIAVHTVPNIIINTTDRQYSCKYVPHQDGKCIYPANWARGWNFEECWFECQQW